LRRSIFRLRVEDLAAPAYVISREGRFSWVNRAMIELLGDLRGEPFVEYVAPEHRQLARANFRRWARTRGSRRC
jgi:PAS domain S-box-containing protein